MSLDERIKHIAWQVVQEFVVPGSSSGAGSAIVGLQSDLRRLASRLDDLHEELHAVATRVTTLEGQPAEPVSDTARMRRTARKAPDA